MILELYHRKLRGENLAIGRTSGDPQGIWASQSPLQIHIHGTLSRVCTKRSNGESSGELVKMGLLFKLRSFAEVGKFTKGFFIGKEGLFSFCRADTMRLTSALELKLEVFWIFCKYVNLRRFAQRKFFVR